MSISSWRTDISPDCERNDESDRPCCQWCNAADATDGDCCRACSIQVRAIETQPALIAACEALMADLFEPSTAGVRAARLAAMREALRKARG